MSRQSTTKKSASLGRGRTLPSVNATFEELQKLNLAQLQKFAENVRLNPPKLKKKDLLRFICSEKKIRHPDDGITGPIPTPSPSSTPLSVARRAEDNGSTSLAQIQVAEVIAPTPSGAVLRYPRGRANRLDTRRLHRLCPPDEQEMEEKFDVESFNRPPANSTPEPDEPPAHVPPADAESLEQTVKMLQAFRRRNEELARQVKEITGTAQALKKTAADLVQSVVAQRASRVRMEVYLKYYRQEQPTFSHKAAFPPKDPVFVHVDKEDGSLTYEMDATDEDREEDFAVYRAAIMSQRAQAGKIPDPNDYEDEDEDDNDDVNDQFDPRKASDDSNTSRGRSESARGRLGSSSFFSGDPKAMRRVDAAHPDPKPKNLKRTASFRDASDTESAESSTGALLVPSQSNEHSAPPRRNKRPRVDPRIMPSVLDRYALHGDCLWDGIRYTPDGPQNRSPSPAITEPDTAPNGPPESTSGVGASSPTDGSPHPTGVFLDPNSALPPSGPRSSGSTLEPPQGASEARLEVAMASPDSESRRLRREESYSALSVRPPQQGSNQ